ncbi:unnamed protein product [Ectocarpus sp. CCAP 1310/34]|nr:unnamed protein product [Ectocarpus sp. CCAP 1310/34]
MFRFPSPVAEAHRGGYAGDLSVEVRPQVTNGFSAFSALIIGVAIRKHCRKLRQHVPDLVNKYGIDVDIDLDSAAGPLSRTFRRS